MVRQQQLNWALTVLGRGLSVLLLGEAGSGKTFLKEAIGAALPGPDTTVVRVSASFGGPEVPWGAMGTAFGLADLHADEEYVAEARLDDRLRVLQSATNSVVLLLDDALLLDRQSIDWISAVARRGSVLVLAAIDRKPHNLDAYRPDNESVLRGLWVDGVAERCDLAPLDDSASLQLAVEFGAGDLDSATQRHIVLQAAGVPLLIRELVLDQLERRENDSATMTVVTHGAGLSGRHPQHALFAAPFASCGPRAFDLGQIRIQGLTPQHQETLILLAELGTIPQQRAAQLVGADALAVLMRRGHVVTDSSASGYVYALDMDANVAAAILTDSPSGRITRRAVNTILESHAAGLQMSPLDAVVVASHWKGADIESYAVARQHFGDELLIWVHVLASAQSNVAGSPNEALDFSRRADRIRPTAAAAVEAAKALASLGQRESALAVLDRCDVDEAGHGCQLAWFRAVASLARFEQGEAAAELLERSLSWHPNDPTFGGERVLAGLAWTDFDHSPADRLSPIIADERVDVLTRLKACGDTAIIAAYRGDLALLTSVLPIAARLGESAPHDPYAELLLRDITVAVFCQFSVAQTLLREQLNQLQVHIEHRMSASIRQRCYSHIASLGAAVGVLAAAHGDYRRAERELKVAAERYTGSEPVGWRAWTACEHATVLATMGRADEATSRLAVVRHEGEPESTWYSYPYRNARIAVRRALGEVDKARSEALSLASDDTLSPVVRVQQLFAAVAMGEPAGGLALVAAGIARRAPLPSLVAMADFLVAKAEGDAVAAYAIGERLRSLDLPEAAKAAFDYASIRAAEVGDGRREKHAARSAALLDSHIRGAAPELTPTLDLSVLTVREQQVVALIETGLANREISERLFLSVRTVESHVYRIRRKLGMARRRDLIPDVDPADQRI
jgi:DNA-binding CsgD family transcriptional regulator/tetratricopeptide (TPR) repeat protein